MSKYTSHTAEGLENHKDAIARALETCGSTAEASAKVNPTWNKSAITDTLRGSISHKQTDDYTEVAGTDVEYARM